MEILSKLFGSDDRVKILRLFLLNAQTAFDSADIATRSKVSRSSIRRETIMLTKIGFIKTRNFVKEVEKKKGNAVKITKKKVSGWQLASDFSLLTPLRNLLISSEPFKKDILYDKLKNSGKIKLIVVAGIFIQNSDSRADILIIGDELKKKSIERVIHDIEAEVGKELVYTYLQTKDFLYRLNIYDKFVRDIFDYPHEVVYDRLGVL